MPTSLLIDINNAAIAMALIAPRAIVCLLILPGFGLSTLQGAARYLAAMAMALPAVVPTFYYVQATPPDFIVAGCLAIKESMLGLLLGVMLSVPFWATQSVAAILDSQRAAVQVQANNASVDRDASALGGMLLQATVVVMMQAGLFVALARILIESYGLWPAFDFTPPFAPGHVEVLIKRVGEFFWHIIVYGAPVIIPLLFVEFGFAMVSVFASNLQVSSASAPVKSLVGMFVLLAFWPTFSHYIAGDFARLLDLVAELLQLSPR
ncbi:EscT/YscT/HrcT family type III secretion system export apparatus protein [Duganella radicis]|uniref:EscT/YscT/HrcT family type III secretion system export apparatus protein n=1 Tax=Duganella radicis TaxID=551988 RepID=A0A6L6PT57_9BURK|nr:flagellar biosynthetic protein FliR [Duganella radicis]MTV41989.1 EscT/YscT/HrcT family type III secretion system export apparatus protein [Duganella radicis]